MSDPNCSIIIPTRDRPQALRECLTALTRLEYTPDRLEVIVVDDASRVSLESIVAEFSDPLRLSLVCADRPGPAAARNTGARRARGDLLAFTDDDCLPEPGWLRELFRRQPESGDWILGGRTVNRLTGNRYASASQLLIDYLYEYYDADPTDARFLTSNNLTVPRERFVSIGGFDELFQRAAAEDRDFCDRWHTLGFGMMLVPEAVVYHAHTLDFKGYWNQQFRYGMGAWRFHRARTRRHRQPVPVEPASFYLDLLRYPFRRRRLASALVLALLLALSQIANAAGFMLARYRDTDHGDSPAVSA